MTRQPLPAGRLGNAAARATILGATAVVLAPAAALAAPAQVSIDTLADKLVISGDPAGAGTLALSWSPGTGYVVSGTLELDAVGPECTPSAGTIVCASALRDTAEISLPGTTARQLTLSGALTDGGAVTATLGDGDDTIDAATLATSLSATTAGGDDTITGSPYPDTIDAGSGDDVVHGGDGGDDLQGGEGDDTLDGGDDFDTISGGDNDDVISGGDGGDDLLGGDGNDTFLMGSEPSPWDAINGGEESPQPSDPWAIDVISYAERTAPVTVTLDASSFTSGNGQAGESHSIEGVEGAIGGSGGDTLQGSAAGNALDGRAGADTLRGGAGDDLLAGGAGADSFEGGAGDDRIEARAATDVLPDTDVKLWCEGDHDTVVRDPLDPAGQGCEADAPGFSTAPLITGTTKVGEPLSVVLARYGDAGTETISWTRCAGVSCATIDGASGAQYTPSASDSGKELKVTVTTTGAGASFVATSASVGPVSPAPDVPAPAPSPSPDPAPGPAPASPAGPASPAPAPSPAPPAAALSPTALAVRKELAAQRLLGGQVSSRGSAKLSRLGERPMLFFPGKRPKVGKAPRPVLAMAAGERLPLDVRARITLTGMRPGPRVQEWRGWTRTTPSRKVWVQGPPVRVSVPLSPVLTQVPAGEVRTLELATSGAQRARAAGMTKATLHIKLKLRAGGKLVTVTQSLPVTVP